MSRKFKVRMMAFHDPMVIREVEVPETVFLADDPNTVLEIIYYRGQNDFQPVPNICSVSMGDVIELHDKLYIVTMHGFKEMSQQEFAEYAKLPRRDRAISQYTR